MIKLTRSQMHALAAASKEWQLKQLQKAIDQAIKSEHDRIEKLLHERIANVTYGTNRDQDLGYKQGLADAVGVIRYVPKDGQPDRRTS